MARSYQSELCTRVSVTFVCADPSYRANHRGFRKDPMLIPALVLFALAAIGGAVLFANDLRKKTGPVVLVVIHALDR